MRLGVKSRIAIVASVFWLGGYSFYYAQGRFKAGADFAEWSRSICDDGNRINHTTVDCWSKWATDYNTFAAHAWTEGFGFSVLYLLAFWIIVAVGYAIVRWILAGRS